MSNNIIRIEVLQYSPDYYDTLETTKKMLKKGIDLRMGLVSSVNFYTKRLCKAPLYGTPPRGMIFKLYNN